MSCTEGFALIKQLLIERHIARYRRAATVILQGEGGRPCTQIFSDDDEPHVDVEVKVDCNDIRTL